MTKKPETQSESQALCGKCKKPYTKNHKCAPIAEYVRIRPRMGGM